MFSSVIDQFSEINKPLSARYAKGFAYSSFKERIPMILTGIVERLQDRDKITNSYGQEEIMEIDGIISKILALKTEIATDAPLREFVETNDQSQYSYASKIYNQLIRLKTKENAGNPPRWFQTEWLFAECYLYFKLHEILFTTKTFKQFDPFLTSKVDSLMSSKSSIISLSKFVCQIKTETATWHEEHRKELFSFFVKCSLWGNRADLSLSGGKVVQTNPNPIDELQKNDSLIIINNLDAAYEILGQNIKNSVIDIVLDNAGYELFNDLCLADFLLFSGMVHKIVFHAKSIPWFVSDVTISDFHLTLQMLGEFGSECVASNVNDWLKHISEGRFVIKDEPFWTLPHDFKEMKNEEPELYYELSQNKLVIFKGDLNYRKLAGDIYWEATKTFRDCLRGFEPTNILTIRTLKAETICGLAPGEFDDYSRKDPSWMNSGKYGVVQIFEKS